MVALPQQATVKLLCSIPAYAHSPGSLVVIARREYGKAGYGAPKKVRVNPARIAEPVEVGGVRLVPDPKILVGQMRIE